MLIRKIFGALSLMFALPLTGHSANVTVTMNAVSKTMTLTDIASGSAVDVGEPVSNVYHFDAPAGQYRLTAFGTDGTTVNGTIALDVTDATSQEFKVITCTVYATNKDESNATWTVDNGDYTLDVRINTREGKALDVTAGNSVTAGRNTFLALNGNSYTVALIPSQKHADEGYTTLYKSGTLTANINVTGAIPMAELYTLSVPSDASFSLGMKFSHFVDFTPVEPVKTETAGSETKLTYKLAHGQVYNYRTSKRGGLTQAGYFTMAADAEKRPVLAFKPADYTAFSPAAINHDVQANQGYETGDIFVNINERGHLALKPGETFKAHAMRSWELTDNSTNNYFMEPDFHYTVIDLDGKPSSGVVEITGKDGSAWSEIKAVGEGTAIVLVTYDAIGLNYYSGANKTPYMGGEYWGAIWPENTAAYVVTVGQGQAAAAIELNMLINAEYNKEALKCAGKYVDAEHDVFYYLDTEEGASYTFTPTGVKSVTMAYPTIGDRMATYTGFGTDGVTVNADGSYTLLLKEGRQIVKLTDASGHSVYQVLTAKTCHREIINATRPGSEIYQPGDEVKIQYSGLRHPANKLAGIYNMSGYVTYNGVPNGSSLILGSGQYTFGSVASAQAVTVKIPADMDVSEQSEIVMDEGVIQVNGYGDPIGNHRIIDPVAGRSPNFTAVAHKTYFGRIPDVKIAVSPVRTFDIELLCNVKDADIKLTFNGNAIEPDASGLYHGTYGTYTLTAGRPGYRCLHATYLIGDDAEGRQTFEAELVASAEAWDGVTLTEPGETDGVYQIANGSELAWFASHVNKGNASASAVLTADIDLGNYSWTPVGEKASVPFSGSFDGQSHAIDGLYIDTPTVQYVGLFGYVKGASADAGAKIENLSVDGVVSAKSYVGGIIGYVHQYVTVSGCTNSATVTATGSTAGGIAGYVANNSSVIKNCVNEGAVSGSSICGGIVGGIVSNGVEVTRVVNVGRISGSKNVGACVGSTGSKDKVTEAYSIYEYDITDGHTLVTPSEMESGYVAYRLGAPFGQLIGEDMHPVIGGPEVKYDAAADKYYNGTSSIAGVETDVDGEPMYYNIHGVASPTPWSGVNIVRYPNGRVDKIVAY